MKAAIPVRCPLQPLIQARICDHNRQEAVVTHVVIQPRNRLVTHAVVSTNDFRDGKDVFHEYLVPVEGMEVVNTGKHLSKTERAASQHLPSL